MDDLDSFEPVARIIVIGVGGAGNNAVNRMIEDSINNVEFYVLNTDKQALSLSKAKNRITIGKDVTKGLGAGGDPSVGKKAAEASKDEIKQIVEGANLVFVAAGMGGGTGTGAAPVICRIAKEAGALAIAIVTRPFSFEGNRKIQYSVEGLNELRESCDALIVVSNDKLITHAGKLSLMNAFSEADGVLSLSVKTVTDLILMPAIMNSDYADVERLLKGEGVAFIGFGTGRGPKKSEDAALSALNCDYIEQSIVGATKGICHITCGPDVTLFEAQECINYIIQRSGKQMDLKFGICVNYQLEDSIAVSLLASGYGNDVSFEAKKIEDVTPLHEETIIEDNTKTDDDFENDIIPNFLENKN